MSRQAPAPVFLAHREEGGRDGYASYDPRTGVFACIICGLRAHRDTLDRPCQECDQVQRFDGDSRIVCPHGHQPDPTPEQLAREGDAALARIRQEML